MPKVILIKPLLSDKSTQLAENHKLNQFTFVVNRDANKIEIKQAIEAQFGVNVLAVNTSVRPGKTRSRVIKGRQTSGRKAPIKKAFVTLQSGQTIDGYYGEEATEEVPQDNTAVANA
jgi:large subunit ribosomal protein L23